MENILVFVKFCTRNGNWEDEFPLEEDEENFQIIQDMHGGLLHSFILDTSNDLAIRQLIMIMKEPVP